jgi:hypothetical protein
MLGFFYCPSNYSPSPSKAGRFTTVEEEFFISTAPHPVPPPFCITLRQAAQIPQTVAIHRHKSPKVRHRGH